MRPDFISQNDINKWLEVIKNDESIPKNLFVENEELLEVCLAGLWLCEELDKQSCPAEIMIRVQYTAAQLSYKKDPWEIHQFILKQYNSNNLIFEDSEEDSLQLN